MAHVNFQPFPTVEPRPAPPEDYQRIGTTPRMFGAGVAAGEEQFGAGATRAAQFFGEVRADDQSNKYTQAVNNVL